MSLPGPHPWDALERTLGDPSLGLPEEVFLFTTRITPMVNVDLLIQDGRGRTLLTWRDDGYCPAGWHVPGGIIRFKETFAQRIAAVALGELGAGVRFHPEPLTVNQVIHPVRRNRGHFISLLFRCELDGPPMEARRHAGGAPRVGDWAWHEGCPEDLLEVHEMYRAYFLVRPD